MWYQANVKVRITSVKNIMKLMSQAEALRQSESFHGGKLTLTSLFHTTFRVSVPHRREIMVSLETMPFIKQIWNVYGYDQWGTKQLCDWLNEKNIRGAASCTRLSTFPYRPLQNYKATVWPTSA